MNFVPLGFAECYIILHSSGFGDKCHTTSRIAKALPVALPMLDFCTYVSIPNVAFFAVSSMEKMLSKCSSFHGFFHICKVAFDSRTKSVQVI